MNSTFTRRRFLGAGLSLPALALQNALAQDERESLGTGQGMPTAGPHPLQTLMAAHPAPLRRELQGVHPRVFVTADGLDQLRRRLCRRR
ncbi:hypothetical protein ACEN88_10630, partial [Massilia sp. CT11-108]